MNRQSDYQSAHRWATIALILSATGLVVFRLTEDAHWLLGFARAFCEAATIGALADWFAVVALFRHPLNIPIPHTAVLPNNKDRVAESLADFLEGGFLTESQLGPRFRAIDYATIASRWLDENAPTLAARAAGFAPRIIDGVSDEEMTSLLATRARSFLSRADIASAAGSAVEIVLQNGRDREIFVATMTAARELVAEHHETIQSKICEEIPISSDLLRGIPLLHQVARPHLEQLRESLARTIARKTIEKMQATLDDAVGDQTHPLYASFQARMAKIIADLKSSSDLSDKIRGLNDSIQSDGAIENFANAAWQEIKSALVADCMASDSIVRQKLEDAIRTAAKNLGTDEAMRAEINTMLGEHVLASVLAAKPHVRELVISTITNWDAGEMAARLEKTVGGDLQFIRLNGTLVGGFIGVVIHLIFLPLAG